MNIVQEKEMVFKDKKVLVAGLARSGTGAASLLSSLGARVTVTDIKPRNRLEKYIKRLPASVEVITDDNPEAIFTSSDIIVVSPGVPLSISPLARAKAVGIPVIGELELAFQAVRSEITGMTEFIGITGTNGKSTTTTIVDLMLKNSGYSSLIGGNIGNSLSEEIVKTGISSQAREDLYRDSRVSTFPEFVVAEISSFQLETIKDFRPKIGAILNITPDHMDRYESLHDYVFAKVRITENQNAKDYIILNADDPICMNMVKPGLIAHEKGGPRLLFFSRTKEVMGIYFKEGRLFYKLPDTLNKRSSHSADNRIPLISVSEIKLQGIHNLENVMAASLIGLLAGCSDEAICAVLRNFSGLEHRLEYVTDIRGIRFINDSKGTNIGAVAKSLEGLENIILIMGGLDKEGDFSQLRKTVAGKVKALILIGEAAAKIEAALGEETETCQANTINEAVQLSLKKASAGDVILLSPGCASFDMFENFEDRGHKFKEAVWKEKRRYNR